MLNLHTDGLGAPATRDPEAGARSYCETTTTRHHPLEKILEIRIAIIEGAMGSTFRTYGMKESDIRG